MSLYSEDEVAKHSTASDAWVIVDGRVHDITAFLDSHPGGLAVTEEHLGADIGAVIRSPAVHEHSSTAFELLEQYCIGRVYLKEEEDAAPTAPIRSWKEDDIIDWSKPLLWQVASIGPLYKEWVHTPVNRKLRLFESDYMETLSRCPWWLVPIVWVPAILYLCYLSMTGQPSTYLIPWMAPSPPLTSLQLLGLLPLGYLLWTLIEYFLHRFVFHLDPPAKSAFWTIFHFAIHGQHHKVPFDTMRLVFPPVPAAIIVFCLYLPLAQLFPLNIGRALFAGGLIGYISYDLTHYYIHHGSPKPGSYFASLKAYHVAHHYLNHNLGFGISSKLWDFPFGTVLRLNGDQNRT